VNSHYHHFPKKKLLTVLGKDASLLAAFSKATCNAWRQCRVLADLIMRPGMINLTSPT